MKLKNGVLALAIALAGLFVVVASALGVKHNKPEATLHSRSAPPGLKKIQQHIQIEIDYEKLPARNEIRLVGRIASASVAESTVNYKWILKDNVQVSRGNITGTMTPGQEVTLDVKIKDMNKKIDVRLEAFVNAKKIKIGNIKGFSFDPTADNLKKSEAIKIQSKTNTKNLSKEEFLEQELKKTRKISVQQ